MRISAISASILTLSSLAVSLLAGSSLSLAASADSSSATAAATPSVATAFQNMLFRHVDGSFRSLEVSCVPEMGQSAANCTLLYQHIGKEEVVITQTKDEVKASAQKAHADALSDPELFCKGSKAFVAAPESELIQDALGLVSALRQVASACTKSAADGLRAFKRVYPRPEAMVGDMMKLQKAEARMKSDTCYISTQQHSRRFLIESDAQLRYEYRYEQPRGNSLGMEIVLFKNTDSDQWNVLEQGIRADSAPASYRGRLDRYIPATSREDRRRMDCRFINMYIPGA